MATLRELRGRIHSIKGIRKITSTMEMVAASRAKKARDSYTDAAIYQETIVDILSGLARASYTQAARGRGQRYFSTTAPSANDTVAEVVIASDRGLCGSYNVSIMSSMTPRNTALPSPKVTRFLVGGRVARSFSGDPSVAYSSDNREKEEDKTAEDVMREVVSLYDKGGLSHVKLIYSRFDSVKGIGSPIVDQLLPFRPLPFTPSTSGHPLSPVFEPEPDIDQVMDALIPRWLRACIHTALLQGRASEHRARQVAMKQATESSDDILKSLQKIYNRTRQSRITNELIEILAATRAIK